MYRDGFYFRGYAMDERLRRVYIPMTETAFYILFSLQEEMHGYRIGQHVSEITGNQVSISPGTMYGTLSKMEKDGLIDYIRSEDKRKFYKINDLGKAFLEIELKRIDRLYKNSKGERIHGQNT